MCVLGVGFDQINFRQKWHLHSSETYLWFLLFFFMHFMPDATYNQENTVAFFIFFYFPMLFLYECNISISIGSCNISVWLASKINQSRHREDVRRNHASKWLNLLRKLHVEKRVAHFKETTAEVWVRDKARAQRWTSGLSGWPHQTPPALIIANAVLRATFEAAYDATEQLGPFLRSQLVLVMRLSNQFEPFARRAGDERDIRCTPATCQDREKN